MKLVVKWAVAAMVMAGCAKETQWGQKCARGDTVATCAEGKGWCVREAVSGASRWHLENVCLQQCSPSGNCASGEPEDLGDGKCVCDVPQEGRRLGKGSPPSFE